MDRSSFAPLRAIAAIATLLLVLTLFAYLAIGGGVARPAFNTVSCPVPGPNGEYPPAALANGCHP